MRRAIGAKQAMHFVSRLLLVTAFVGYGAWIRYIVGRQPWFIHRAAGAIERDYTRINNFFLIMLVPTLLLLLFWRSRWVLVPIGSFLLLGAAAVIYINGGFSYLWVHWCVTLAAIAAFDYFLLTLLQSRTPAPAS